MPAPRRTVRVPVIIVGGGIAGLSAAWQLDRRGFPDYVLLEMEREAGGNARGGENAVSRYPWAAHYVPVHGPRATFVRELFRELGVLTEAGWDERTLCFAPQERLFVHGEWQGGLESELLGTRTGRDELRQFDELIDEQRRSGEFTIPMALGARAGSPLDRVSFSEWLDAAGFRSPAMRWYAEYGTRDDYGALTRDTSAWAGFSGEADQCRSVDEPGCDSRRRGSDGHATGDQESAAVGHPVILGRDSARGRTTELGSLTAIWRKMPNRSSRPERSLPRASGNSWAWMERAGHSSEVLDAESRQIRPLP
jgi:hypothetical protein